MISLTNTTNRMKVFNLSHDVFCAANGKCTCSKTSADDNRLVPASLTIPAGMTLSKLPAALLVIAEIIRAIEAGELIFKHLRTWSKSQESKKDKPAKQTRRKKK